MDQTRNEIRKLEAAGNNDELGGYLIDLAKYGEQPHNYEDEFEKHFDSPDWYLRKAAVFCLLFALQIDKPEYRLKAINFVKDGEEDDEIRRWTAAGLAQTYRSTKDKELLQLFMELVEDEQEENDMKESFLRDALLIYGLSSRDQAFRNSSFLPELGEMLKTFGGEIADIKALIKR
jgi:hypothetical protein